MMPNKTLLIFLVLAYLSSIGNAQINLLNEVTVGVNQTSLLGENTSRKTGFQIGFGSSFRKARKGDETDTVDKFSISSLTRYSRRSFLFSQDGVEIDLSSIELGAGPKLSFEFVDLSFKALFVIPVSNSAKNFTNSRLKKEDFDNPFGGLLGEIYFKFSPRVHVGLEYSIFSSPYYQESTGRSSPSGIPLSGSTSKRELNWFGLNVRYSFQKES